MDFQKELSALAEKGLTFASCLQHFGIDRDANPYAAKAKEKYESEGEVEIDSTTVLSDSSGGQYVLAWVWVGDNEVPKSVEADDQAEPDTAQNSEMQNATSNAFSLPGVWLETQPGWYVREYNGGQAYIEAHVVDGVLLLKAVVVRNLGNVMLAGESVGERRVDPNDRSGVECAVTALEGRLVGAEEVTVIATDTCSTLCEAPGLLYSDGRVAVIGEFCPPNGTTIANDPDDFRAIDIFAVRLANGSEIKMDAPERINAEFQATRQH